MTLPFLPGNIFNKKLGVTRFHKSHHLDTVYGLPLEVGMYKPGLGGQRRPFFQWKKPTKSFIPRGEPGFPCQVDLTNQVLCFEAFFQEAVTEMREGTFRLRKVKIYYHLEDDSIMVVEARVKNSSLSQGVLVKRQRVPRPQPSAKEFYTAEDFNLQNEINMHGRVYKICNCDPFTKTFYRKLGIVLNPPLPLPTVFKEKEMWEEKNGRKLRSENLDQLHSQQFFQRDPLVLRFFCFWDDRHNQFGDLHQLILHYFLSDDTIEIIEILPPNSGRDSVPWFLRRIRLPKRVAPMKRIGENSKHSVLNVLAEGEWDYRYLLDPLEMGRVGDDCYSDGDLSIGSRLNIYNREVIVYDLDDFTKKFFTDKYGINDFTPADCPLPTELKKEAACKYNRRPEWSDVTGCNSTNKNTDKEVNSEPIKCTLRDRFLEEVKAYEKKWCYLPPYNGFGTEEDSIGNCLSLHPEQKSTKNLIKFLTNDRRGLESNILRFSVSLLTDHEADRERHFTLNFFRTDDSFEIHETKISGYVGGTFSSRRKMAKPCQERFNTKLTSYYGDEDLMLGKVLTCSGHSFLITAADEYALHYMEEKPNEFPQSDWRLVMQKLVPIPSHIDVKKHLDVHREEERMHYNEFKRILSELYEKIRKDGDCLKEHDYITLARHFRVISIPTYDLECKLLAMRVELRRLNFEEFDSLCYQAVHHDKRNSGLLPTKTLLTVFKALKMPLKHSLLQEVLDHMAEGDGRVRYCRVINELNWKTHALNPCVDDKCQVKKMCEDLYINYNKFCQQLVDMVYH